LRNDANCGLQIISIIEDAARREPTTTAFEILQDEWGTMSTEGGTRMPTLGVLLELLIDINAIRAASYLAKEVMGESEITADNANLFVELHRPMSHGEEPITASVRVALAAAVPNIVDFSDFDVAMEEEMANLGIGAADFDNSDFLTTPVPPENTFEVHNVPFAYLKRITADFAAKDRSRFVGKGGFAEVYLGVTEGQGMRLAVKRLSKAASDLTASANDRTFNYEVSELSRLKHSNLIEILGYSNDVKESVCLIYPYFVNGNLEDRLQMRRTHHQELVLSSTPVTALTVGHRMQILSGVASGLNFLHTRPKPLIHRDIKTPNILLDDSDKPKIADFGLLRHASQNDTETVNIQGTPRYMAPEALRGDLDVKMDVYSFGAVTLEMVTGLKSFDEDREDKDIITHVKESLECAPNQQSLIAELLDSKAEWPFEMAQKLLIDLAMACLENKHKRPTMSAVLDMLKVIEERL
jgi:hypothetical protein